MGFDGDEMLRLKKIISLRSPSAVALETLFGNTASKKEFLLGLFIS
jgi:hypothetical protein